MIKTQQDFLQTHIRAARMSRGRALCRRPRSTAGCRTRRPGRAAYRPDRVPAAPAAGRTRSRCSGRPISAARFRVLAAPREGRLSPRRRVPRRCRPGDQQSEGLKATCVGRTRPARREARYLSDAPPARWCAARVLGMVSSSRAASRVRGGATGFNASARGGGIEPTRRRGTMQVQPALARGVPDVPVNDDPRPHEVLAAPGASLGQHGKRPLRRRCVTNVDSGFPASGRAGTSSLPSGEPGVLASACRDRGRAGVAPPPGRWSRWLT